MFDPIDLKATIARLNRRRAMFEAWCVVMGKDLGLCRPGGLPAIESHA